MKTVPKVLLLIFGIAQLIFVLYISLPAIPRRIVDEIPGDMYEFGDIRFNLVSSEYIESSELKEYLEGEGEDSEVILVLRNEKNNDTITIFQITDQETINLIEDDFSAFSNPLRHKFISSNIVEEVGNYSERIEDFNQIKNTKYTIFKGKDKTALLSSQTYNLGVNDITNYSADVRIGNLFFTILPYQPGDNNQLALDNIMKFMRTVTLK